MEKFVFSGTSVSQVLLANPQLWGHPLLYGENTCARRRALPSLGWGGLEEPRAPRAHGAMGTPTCGSTGDPAAAPGTPGCPPCPRTEHTLAQRPHPGQPPPSTWCGGCGGVRRACGQRRALGRRRCRRPWGSPRPCPCACRWGPGGCHPSTWGGSQGPALQGRDAATSAPAGERPPELSHPPGAPARRSVWHAVLRRPRGPPTPHPPPASGQPRHARERLDVRPRERSTPRASPGWDLAGSCPKEDLKPAWLC